MGDIRFDEDREFVRPAVIPRQGGLIELVQKWGIAKNERQAQYFLLGTMIISIFIMLGIYFSGGQTQTPVNQLPPDARSSGALPR